MARRLSTTLLNVEPTGFCLLQNSIGAEQSGNDGLGETSRQPVDDQPAEVSGIRDVEAMSVDLEKIVQGDEASALVSVRKGMIATVSIAH